MKRRISKFDKLFAFSLQLIAEICLSPIIIVCGSINEKSTNLIGSNEKMDGFFFELFTREEKSGYRLDSVSVAMLAETSFNPKIPTKICIHGWMGSVKRIFSKSKMKDNYLDQANPEVNVLGLDWSICSKNVIYLLSIKCVPKAGRFLMDALKVLVEMGNSPNMIHIIGFSLGAHIAGYATSKLNLTVSRITGLEPANPFFDWVGLGRHLKKTDAQFVDIIHTDMWKMGSPHHGHVDFYPNGGHSPQPGCLWENRDDAFACSNFRSVRYFAESIITKVGFYAVECNGERKFKKGDCDNNDLQLMGEHANHSIGGYYYLDTNAKPPFALGKFLHRPKANRSLVGTSINAVGKGLSRVLPNGLKNKTR